MNISWKDLCAPLCGAGVISSIDVLQNLSTYTHMGSGIIVYGLLYIVDFGSETRFHVSEQVGALFLVEMCKPASDTF